MDLKYANLCQLLSSCVEIHDKAIFAAAGAFSDDNVETLDYLDLEPVGRVDFVISRDNIPLAQRGSAGLPTSSRSTTLASELALAEDRCTNGRGRPVVRQS